MKTEERLDKAKARYDRAADKHWQLLGWGTNAEIAQASQRVVNAKKELERAEKAYAKAIAGQN